MKKNKGLIINFEDIQRCLQYSNDVWLRFQAAINLIFKYNKLSGDDAVKLEVLAQNAVSSLNNSILSAQKYVLHFENNQEISNEVPLYILGELAIAYKAFNLFFKELRVDLVGEHTKLGIWNALEEMKALRNQMEHRENNHNKHKLITMSNYSSNTDGAIRFDVWGYKQDGGSIKNTVLQKVENFKMQEYVILLSEYMKFETDHLFEIFDENEIAETILVISNKLK